MERTADAELPDPLREPGEDVAVEGAGPQGRRPVRRGVRARALARRARLVRLLPTPRRAPFSFGYGVLLLVTSLVLSFADDALADALLQGSSTDVAHLAGRPAFVLVASALWVAGGLQAPYAVVFLLVLTALERRIGPWRTLGVFVLGHVAATLATEVPVALSVIAGRLPDSSLHRMDYGISFGVAASAGALTGLLRPWRRWTALGALAVLLLLDLLFFDDPLTAVGHVLALLIGVAIWPLVRASRWRGRARQG